MKPIKMTCILSLLSLLATGCWNSKDIQTMAYVTAIGLDFKDGQYITYVQVLNFSNVAKGEMTEVGKVVPNWIGKGVGKTVTESFNNIYSTSQLRIFWGHVKTIVCSENYLMQGEKVKEAYDMINRYREVRYNVLLYGTKLPLRDIFAQKSILNLSPLETIMFSPAQAYSQRSYILPVYGFKIISQVNEPAQPGMIPSLTIDKHGWTEDYKQKSMFKIDGAYYFHDQRVCSWLSVEDLRGARWMQRKLDRSPINIPSSENPSAALVVRKPKISITPVVDGDSVIFNLKGNALVYLDELNRNMDEKTMERQAAKVIEDEIRYTFKKGLQVKADVLNLEEELYRRDPRKWRELQEGDEDKFLLDEHSLGTVDVTIRLLHTGKYKGRTN